MTLSGFFSLSNSRVFFSFPDLLLFRMSVIEMDSQSFGLKILGSCLVKVWILNLCVYPFIKHLYKNIVRKKSLTIYKI